jgi:hemerythrin superfamily protein
MNKEKKLLNYILKDLFCALTDEDVLKVVGKDIYLGEEKLDKKTIDLYRDEAIKMLNSPLYKHLSNKMKNEANKVMFEKSKTEEDMIFGKAMLHSLVLYEGFLKIISKLNIK